MRYLAASMLLATIGLTAACTRGKSYELRGQIVAVDATRQEITVAHEDIRGFMPGMTMAFKVREPALMAGRVPGELIRATLIVEDSLGYLAAIEVTGRGPVKDSPPAAAFNLLGPGEAAPDVQLVDQGGIARRFSDWRGHVVAVTFIYTRCPMPDFCPLMDRRFAAVQRALAATPASRDAMRLLSVSIDPAFDTPAVLAEHARRAGAAAGTWSYVTGDPAELERFASRFGVSVMREDAKGVELTHNLRTAVIDRQGRLTRVFGGSDWTAEQLTAEMTRAAGGS